MAFRDLFFKPVDPKPSTRPLTTLDLSPLEPSLVTDSETPPTPGPDVEPAAEDDGSIHLPHRGLVPFKPQVRQLDTPSHIPYRGLAPFRPNAERVGGSQPDTISDEIDAGKLQELRTKPLIEVSPDTVSGKVENPNHKHVSQSISKAEFEEVRERPREAKRTTKPRVPRHSSGWTAMLKHLKEEPSLRVLDIGPTSPNNINFLTGMGHSIYMADIVQEAFESEWALTDQVEEDDLPPDVQAFCDQNLNFHDRRFDVVLLWATIDYLPPSLIPAVIARLHDCMELGGQMLAFFHTRTTSSEAVFYRYHLVDNTSIDMQHNAPYPVLRVYTNREVERLFKNFSGCKFFLARDNVLEVIVTR